MQQIITILFYLKYWIYIVKNFLLWKKKPHSIPKVRVSNDFSTNTVQHCTKLLHLILPVNPEGWHSPSLYIQSHKDIYLQHMQALPITINNLTRLIGPRKNLIKWHGQINFGINFLIYFPANLSLLYVRLYSQNVEQSY